MQRLKDEYVTVQELEQDIYRATGNRALATKQAQLFAIHYRGEVIDAVRYRKGWISQDDLVLSRHIRWQHHSQHSKKLAENMIAAGRGPRPRNVEAHHVVPWNENRSAAAKRSRLRLAAWGIDIDHEANGVWLPASSKFLPHSSFPMAGSHRASHTTTYYLNVEYLLTQTIAEGLGRRGIIETLREIGEDLQSNEFPINKLIEV